MTASSPQSLVTDDKQETTKTSTEFLNILRQKIGNLVYGDPIIVSQEEYMNLLLAKSMGEYYLQKSKAVDEQYRAVRYKKGDESIKNKGLVLPSLTVNNKIFQTIFGGDKIELIPKGYASLDLGIYYQN